MAAQEPLVRIGTVLDYCGHKMPVTKIRRDGVMVMHQGREIQVGREAVEKSIAANE